MRKKVEYAKPEDGQEEFVRHIFSKNAKELGFEIIKIQKAFPDCTALDIRNGRNKVVHIELEYRAGNFIRHGHDQQMKPGEEYLVVCWQPEGRNLIPAHIECIVLQDTMYNFEIRDPELDYPFSVEEHEKPIYCVLPFVTSVAGRPFEQFENVTMFRNNHRFEGKRLPKSSVIVLKENNMLIGEFTVLAYHYIEKPPETEYEKQLYALINYPVTIVDDVLAEDWIRGHIVYTDFKVYRPSVPASILTRFSNGYRNANIKREELQIIRGNQYS